MISVAAQIRHRIVRRLREMGAVSPTTAKPLEALNALEWRGLERLVRRGLVKEEGSALYLDESAYEAFQRSQRRRALMMAAAMLVLMAVAFVLQRALVR